MKRLSIEAWSNIFRNLQEMNKEEYCDGAINWVETVWLDSDNEWCLCYGTKLFEDGFQSEREANERLEYLEGLILK